LIDVRKAMTTFLDQIEQLAAQHPAYVNLLPLPGIGPMIASAYIAAIGNGRQFKCGRQVSAWLGLVPRQYGTGGTIQLKGMTKNGDRYLRTVRRQSIWHHLSLFLRDTFLPVLSPV
jgi:transposase